MSEVFNSSSTAEALQGFRAAKYAISRGDLIVLPTDTVYGIGADAFNPAAVNRLIAAKGRTRQMPPPVLVSGKNTLAALAAEVTEPVQKLVDAFWPGPLTIVTMAQPSLNWDLGETRGTVALRMPKHELTLELLQETGPLAVSSANLHGQPAATTAAQAQQMLAEEVAVYLEDGQVAGDGTASTIVDVTAMHTKQSTMRVLRQGVITVAQLAAVLPEATIE